MVDKEKTNFKPSITKSLDGLQISEKRIYLVPDFDGEYPCPTEGCPGQLGPLQEYRYFSYLTLGEVFEAHAGCYRCDAQKVFRCRVKATLEVDWDGATSAQEGVHIEDEDPILEE